MLRTSRGRTARALSAALLSAAAALALVAAPAVASTTVTAPADGAPFVGDTISPSLFTASGTATLETNVTLKCARRNPDGWHYATLDGGLSVPVVGGQWTAPAVQVPFGLNPCRLLAFPAGGSTPPQATDPRPTYQGPLLRFGALDPIKLTAGTNAGGPRDFSWDAGGAAGTAFVTSLGTDGIAGTDLVGPDPAPGSTVFSRANVVAPFAPDSPSAGTGNGRTLGVQVDGVNAMTVGLWVRAGGDSIPFGSYGNVPTVTATPSVTGDGSLALTEHDTLRRCTGAGADPSQYPLGGQTCPNSLADPGVRLNVTTTLTPGGSVLRRDWKLVSTDGAAHAVRLVLADYVSSDSGDPRTWRIAGGAYAQHVAGDVVTDAIPTSAPFSVAARRAGGPDPDPEDGLGAVTFGVRPTELRFTGPRQLTGTYDLEVRAGGVREATFVYGTEDDQAAIDADIAAAEAALRPAGEVVVPPGDGAPDPPGLDPSVIPDPPPGETAPREEPRPGPGRPPAAPALVRSGRPSLKAKRLKLGYAVRCPGTGPSCTARVRLVPRKAKKAKRAPKPLAKATVTVKAGKTVVLVLKVKASRRTIARAKPSLTVRLTRGSLKPRTTTKRWHF